MIQQVLTPNGHSSDSTHSPGAVSDVINPGSAIASLWIRTSQDNQPPASVPCSVMPVPVCPQCQQFNLVWQASGLQRCSHCGWIG